MSYISKEEGKCILHFEVTNLDEFKALITQADKEAQQLNKTIAELKRFDLNITIGE